MSGKTVSTEEAQAQLKNLLDLVRDGDEVLISEDEKVFARLAPVKEEVKEEKKRRTPGLHRGVVKYISPDFDDPVDESFLLGEDK
jgi:antitoxin (DNA-binding transcriptional repressor) of toxin-antitoxin stability system